MPLLSANTYRYKVEEGYLKNNPSAMLDAFTEYQRSHCYNPSKIHLSSAHDCLPVYREVDCGKCYHCRETKINSWVTRCYAHCEYFKHVYFVTLTYRPFYTLNSVSSLVLGKLGSAIWHFDDINENHRLCWNPCLLVKKHYQDFLKRLRKNTGYSDISYIVSGEYGHKYGRPHFHLILFSNHQIHESDIRNAWSFQLWKSDDGVWSFLRSQKSNGRAFQYSIGRVDFHDLVVNGSFNEKHFLVDGKDLNARNCFSYVCKYVCKNDEFNSSRVDIAYNNLFHKLDDEKMDIEQYHKFMLDLCETESGSLQQIVKDLRIKNHLKFTKNYVYYGKKSFFPSEKVYYFGQNFFKFNEIKQESECIFPEAIQDFRDLFRQFVEVSRGTPIGSLYAKDHMAEFVEGKFGKPSLQSNGFVVPSYFRRKAEEFVYGLRKVQKTISGKSLAFSPLPLLKKHFEDVLSGKVPLAYLYYPERGVASDNFIRNARNVFKDVSSSEYILFPVDPDTGSVCARYYRYNRKLRHYVPTRSQPLSEFLSLYVSRLDKSCERFAAAKNKGEYSARLCDQAAILLEEYGYTLKNLRSKFRTDQDSYLKFRQHTYHASHTSVE